MESKVRVPVLIASNRKFEPETVMSLVQGLFESAKHICDIKVMPWAFIDKSRNELTRQCIQLWGNHPPGVKVKTMWLDDDMLWPPHIIKELIAHDKPVAGGLYFSRTKPYNCTAFNFVGEGLKKNSGLVSTVSNRDHLVSPITKWPHNGTMEVDGLGLGATMIDLDLFKKMRDFYGDEKWFRCEEGGEDVHFFARLNTMGYRALLDTSVKCGHMTTDVVDEETWALYHPEEAAAMGFFTKDQVEEVGKELQGYVPK
jgi:hypothetical protein